MSKNPSRITIKKALDQFKNYQLIDRVQQDLIEQQSFIKLKEELSHNDSFEVLPDHPSDEEKLERGELKRFTVNTHSGKSLVD